MRIRNTRPFNSLIFSSAYFDPPFSFSLSLFDAQEQTLTMWLWQKKTIIYTYYTPAVVEGSDATKPKRIYIIIFLLLSHICEYIEMQLCAPDVLCAFTGCQAVNMNVMSQSLICIIKRSCEVRRNHVSWHPFLLFLQILSFLLSFFLDFKKIFHGALKLTSIVMWALFKK